MIMKKCGSSIICSLLLSLLPLIDSNDASTITDQQNHDERNLQLNDTLLSSSDLFGSSSTTPNATQCQIIGFLPFTIFTEPTISYGLRQPPTTNWVYTQLAGGLMARDHFNARNPVVVPELASRMMQECSVQLPEINFANSNGDVFAISNYVFQNYGSRPDEVCALVGAVYNDPSIDASIMANGLDVPYVTHFSEELELTNTALHPRASRVSANLFTIGEVIMSYLRQIGKDDFLVTLAVINEYGDQWREAIESAAEDFGIKNTLELRFQPPWAERDRPGGLLMALKEIKDSGYRNIIVALNGANPDRFHALADFAEELDLNNGDYFWIVSGNIDFDAIMQEAVKSTNLTKLVRGMAFFRILDGFLFDRNDPFLSEWKQQNQDMVDRANAQSPRRVFQAAPGYFQINDPERGASFMYDAIMSVGFSKCLEESRAKRAAAENAAQNSATSTNNGNSGAQRRAIRGLRRKNSSPSGRRKLQVKKGKKGKSTLNKHYKALLDTKFTGASGRVQFRDGGRFLGARKRTTIVYGVYNIREIEPNEKFINPNYTSWYYLTNILRNTTTESNWEESVNAPFVYADGRTVAPELNRDVPPQNHLSRGVQATGLTFMSIALVLVFASIIFVFLNRGNNLLKRNQPPFLFVLMGGAGMMSLAILTLSFDESYGFSDSMLNGACLATPWLLSIGYSTIYLAMFSKLLRINKVMQFRKRAVKFSDVIKFFAIIGSLVIVVLIIWSAVDPFFWVRSVIVNETGESYGRCSSRHVAAFVTPLALLMATSTIACGVMAYKCRDIDARYSEASWIFYTIFVQVQVLLVGIPILFILDDASADATYLGRSLLIFAIVMTTIILMIGPKVALVLGWIKMEEGGRRSRSGGGGGAGGVRVSGLNTVNLHGPATGPTTPVGGSVVGRSFVSTNTSYLQDHSDPRKRSQARMGSLDGSLNKSSTPAGGLDSSYNKSMTPAGLGDSLNDSTNNNTSTSASYATGKSSVSQE